VLSTVKVLWNIVLLLKPNASKTVQKNFASKFFRSKLLLFKSFLNGAGLSAYVCLLLVWYFMCTDVVYYGDKAINSCTFVILEALL
jgi:hypothetical protein